jgi:hypothetical protein
MPIGIRPSDEPFAGAAGAAGAAAFGAGAAGAEESGESGIAAVIRDAETLLSNKAIVNNWILRMVAPQEEKLSIRNNFNSVR